MTNWDKNENEKEKIWKKEINFWILHIRIRLCGNFHENIWEKNLTHFLRHFWLIEAKMKMKMKKIGKISSIFEFSISKLGFKELFMKIWGKSFFSKFLPEKDKLGHIYCKLPWSLSEEGLFRYVWPFSEHQALKG